MTLLTIPPPLIDDDSELVLLELLCLDVDLDLDDLDLVDGWEESPDSDLTVLSLLNLTDPGPSVFVPSGTSPLESGCTNRHLDPSLHLGKYLHIALFLFFRADRLAGSSVKTLSRLSRLALDPSLDLTFWGGV